MFLRCVSLDYKDKVAKRDKLNSIVHLFFIIKFVKC